MLDPQSSVSSNNSPLDYASSPNTARSTGVNVDAFTNSLQNQQILENQVKNLENQALTDIDKQANLHDLHDPSLAPRLAMESKAGHKVPSPQDLNQVLGQSSTQAVINELHLKGLTTAASGETNAPEKMGAFMAVASMPWTSSEAVLKPQYDRAVAARNPFVEAVRENPIAKIAALTFIPTTPFALWTLMGGQTSADQALSVVSLAQNEFVIKGIQDGSIRDFSTRVNSGMDFLKGMKLESIKAESNPSLKFVGLLLDQVMRSEEKPNAPQETVTDNHIIGAREFLNELNAFLTKKPEDIALAVKENGGSFALKAMVQAVSGVPPLLEAKYHAGPKVDSLMKTIGITEEEAGKHLTTLDKVGGFFKNILGLQVKEAETVLEEARKSSEKISKQAAQQLMTGLAKTVNDPKTRQGINEANSNLANLATQLVQTVSDKANQQLISNLADVNKAINLANNAHLN
jgi:hypothetical protein